MPAVPWDSPNVSLRHPQPQGPSSCDVLLLLMLSCPYCRSQGLDHFIWLTHDRGACDWPAEEDPGLANVIKVVHFGWHHVTGKAGVPKGWEGQIKNKVGCLLPLEMAHLTLCGTVQQCTLICDWQGGSGRHGMHQICVLLCTGCRIKAVMAPLCIQTPLLLSAVLPPACMNT